MKNMIINALQEKDFPDKELLVELRYINGFFCIFRRHSGLMNWLSYVVVPTESYRLSKKDIKSLEIHGGITFNSKLKDHKDYQELIELSAEKQSNKSLIIGFDTGHPQDISPCSPINLNDSKSFKEYIKILPQEIQQSHHDLCDQMKKILAMLLKDYKPTYKDINFCIDEMKKLTEQIQKFKITKDDTQQ